MNAAPAAGGDGRPRLLLIGGPDVDQRLELMDGLAPEFDCAAAGSEPRLEERFRARGYPYFAYRLSRRFDLAADARAAWELARLCRRQRPAVVHCFDTKPAVVGRLGARLAGVGVVVGTLPGLGALWTYDTPAVARRRAVFRHLHRLAARVSDATVFQNPDDRDRLVGERVVAAAKAVLMPGSGVSARRFAPASPEDRRRARRALGIGDGEEVAVMLARLIRAKGVLDLAHAAPEIRRRRPRCRLLLAGPRDPEALDALTPEELAEVGAAVEWLGPHRDPAALLAAADLFVFPSAYREGLPRVLVEAALAGVPIVTTDVPGCREVVADGRSGVLVPPRQPGRLAAAVAGLLADRKLAARLAQAARRRALERFELGAVVAEHRSLYRRLLAGHRSRVPAPPADGAGGGPRP